MVAVRRPRASQGLGGASRLVPSKRVEPSRYTTESLRYFRGMTTPWYKRDCYPAYSHLTNIASVNCDRKAEDHRASMAHYLFMAMVAATVCIHFTLANIETAETESLRTSLSGLRATLRILVLLLHATCCISYP